MSSSAVLQHSGMQENVALLANSPDMIELTDEELTQVAGAWSMEHMRPMREACCVCHCARPARFSLTRLRIMYRLDFMHLSVDD